MKPFFSAYVVEPRALQRPRSAAPWIVTLREKAGTAPVVRGSRAPIVLGDPGDGLALEIGEDTWGAPNRWMKEKGLDATAGLVAFAPVQHAPPGTPCLVPVTAFMSDDGRLLRDPNHSCLTLAALRWSVVSDNAAPQSGFCLLTLRVRVIAREEDAVLAIGEEHHDEWLDGWKTLADVQNCAAPVAGSTLVAD